MFTIRCQTAPIVTCIAMSLCGILIPTYQMLTTPIGIEAHRQACADDASQCWGERREFAKKKCPLWRTQLLLQGWRPLPNDCARRLDAALPI